jgi:hypothetical protein
MLSMQRGVALSALRGPPRQEGIVGTYAFDEEEKETFRGLVANMRATAVGLLAAAGVNVLFLIFKQARDCAASQWLCQMCGPSCIGPEPPPRPWLRRPASPQRAAGLAGCVLMQAALIAAQQDSSCTLQRMAFFRGGRSGHAGALLSQQDRQTWSDMQTCETTEHVTGSQSATTKRSHGHATVIYQS